MLHIASGVPLRNTVVLSAAQAINGAIAPLSIALGGLVGLYLLGSDKSLATAPITGYNIGVAIAALPAAMLMSWVGRRRGFISGAFIGIAGLALCSYSVLIGSFWLFAVGMLLNGTSGSFVQQYRFAAADLGDEQQRARAISWVLAGGVVAAIIGPQLIIHTKDLFLPVQFAGAFFAGIGLLAIGIVILCFLREQGPRVPRKHVDRSNQGRPLLEIASQPKFFIAVLCAVGAYGLMSFVMTGAPLAMVECGISIVDATLGIQWHVIAMFAPSFFTGELIARFGKERVVAAGLIILSLSAVVALTGLDLWRFWAALILLGVGWNFGFIGATAMLTDSYRPEEKSRAQGLNDFVLFSSVALASLMSGQVLNTVGWTALNIIVFPVVALCLCGLAYLWRKQASAS
jgi:MFS family permease